MQNKGKEEQRRIKDNTKNVRGEQEKKKISVVATNFQREEGEGGRGEGVIRSGEGCHGDRKR